MNKTFKISEGQTKIWVFNKNNKSNRGPGKKDKQPFYNPSMELNRDLSIPMVQWLVNSNKKSLKVLDGLAATGIRGVRFAKEIKGDYSVFVNDWDKESYNLIRKNIKLNNLTNIVSTNKNLNSLLSEESFDYIDIDPFGTPVYFIDSAMRSIHNNGIIAVTATDTATLCGVYPKVCLRRYGSIPLHGPVMKEIGLRILIGFICRTAAIYDKGIKPVLCYCTDHYFRLYIQVKNGINHANNSVKNLKMISSKDVPFSKKNVNVGPLWMDKTSNDRVIKELRSILSDKKLGTKNNLWKLLDLLEEESKGPPFFYTTDKMASILKCSPPRLNVLFSMVKKQGYDVYRTHYSSTSFKTNASSGVVENFFK